MPDTQAPNSSPQTSARCWKNIPIFNLSDRGGNDICGRGDGDLTDCNGVMSHLSRARSEPSFKSSLSPCNFDKAEAITSPNQKFLNITIPKLILGDSVLLSHPFHLLPKFLYAPVDAVELSRPTLKCSPQRC